jgi:hypothetical protein
VSRCHVCDRPLERDEYWDEDWKVVLRNRLIVSSCQWCWMLWPDAWKHFPPIGFGRWSDIETPWPAVSREEVVDLLVEIAESA